MATQEITSIIAYEHDKLYSCNEVCESCGANNEEACCISYCKPVHFKELQEYCSNQNKDCGFDYSHKYKCIKFDKYAGIIQLQDGTYLEILPKITHNAPIKDSRKIFQNLILVSHNLTKEYKYNKITNTQIHKSNYILEIFISAYSFLGSIHLPQLSQILVASKSHLSHSPQSMHSLSYNTHSLLYIDSTLKS